MNEGYAIFLNNDGTETKLSWDELKLEENGKKYGYVANQITDNGIDCVAFYNNERLKEINIPEDIEYIEHDSFNGCTQLEKVILPSTLKAIRYNAFCNTAIKEIDIPKSVKYVDSDAFYECKLEKITASRGIYIDSDLINIVERTNEIAVSLQDFYNNCEKNDIKLFKEENDGLEQGIFLVDLDQNNFVQEERDFSVYADALKLKSENGERYFTLSQLDEYYEQHREYSDPDFNYSYILYRELNDDIKQIVKYSEKLGIKPDLNNNANELREQYIEKIETQNKAYQEYISKLEKEFLVQKDKENERDNTQVQANEIGRD